MEKNLKSLVPMLNAVSYMKSPQAFPVQFNQNSPANKNIVPQRKFQAKKRRKLRNSLQHSSTQDKQNTALSVILNYKDNLQTGVN